MPNFKFKARRSSGQTYTEERLSKDKYELYREIKSQGGEVISVTEVKVGGINLKRFIPTSLFTSVSTHDKITFARNLGSMIDAGLSVTRALSVMEHQARNKNLREIFATLNNEIAQGKTLSDSMVQFKNVFSNLFISMVRSGEQSGTLANSLKILAIQMDRTYSLQRRIKGAMMYPSIILIAMVIIGILMLTYIVPTLASTFIELKVALPLSTRIIISISDAIRNHGLLLLTGIIALAGVVYYSARTLQGKKILNYAIIKIPVIGEIVKEVNAARTSRTLSSLLGAGVDVVEATKITGEILQNYHYKKVLELAGESIKKGDPMSKVFLDNTKLYPIFVGEMMNVGEETGKMGEMLLGVATFYEEDVEQKTKDMSTIIEPILMVVIATGVGFFAIAMISPMYSLSNVI